MIFIVTDKITNLYTSILASGVMRSSLFTGTGNQENITVSPVWQGGEKHV
jgi:hypothetical protein